MYAHRNPTRKEIRMYGLYRHVDKPTALKGQGKGTCNLFLRTGDCRYGDKCVFSHNTCRTTPNERGRAKRSQSATPAAEWEEEEWEKDEWEEDE